MNAAVNYSAVLCAHIHINIDLCLRMVSIKAYLSCTKCINLYVLESVKEISLLLLIFLLISLLLLLKWNYGEMSNNGWDDLLMTKVGKSAIIGIFVCVLLLGREGEFSYFCLYYIRTGNQIDIFCSLFQEFPLLREREKKRQGLVHSKYIFAKKVLTLTIQLNKKFIFLESETWNSVWVEKAKGEKKAEKGRKLFSLLATEEVKMRMRKEREKEKKENFHLIPSLKNEREKNFFLLRRLLTFFFHDISTHHHHLSPSSRFWLRKAPTHTSTYIHFRERAREWRTTDNKRQVSWNLFCSSIKFSPQNFPPRFCLFLISPSTSLSFSSLNTASITREP